MVGLNNKNCVEAFPKIRSDQALAGVNFFVSEKPIPTLWIMLRHIPSLDRI
jgi:hypothetical protein